MTNEEVLQRVDEKRSLITTIRKRQKNRIERNHRRKNGGKKKERKTATDDAGMDDDRRIQRAEGKGTAKRGVPSLEVGICRRAENLKKKREHVQTCSSIVLSYLLQMFRELTGRYSFIYFS